MNTSLRTTFNEDVQNYDIARPDYPKELFTDTLSYLDERKAGKSAIEIGIGTGQATKPFLDAGFQVTAIELGDKLAAYSDEKFRAYPSLHILCADFMEAAPESAGSFDLLYAATAFHWLPKPDGYLRAKEMLRDGGVIALFWNHPYMRRQDDPTNLAAPKSMTGCAQQEKRFLSFTNL